MDSFRTQKTKPKKMKRHVKKSRVQIILDLLFRAIEVLVVFVTITKLCYELVIMLEDSGVAAVILANRSLAFVVGNAIIISLMANSGLLSNKEVDPKYKTNDLYNEFVRQSSRRGGGISRADIRSREKQSEVQNEAKPANEAKPVNETKQVITEIKAELNEEKQSTTVNRVEESSSEKREEEQSIVEHQDKTLKMEKHNLTEKRQSMSYQRSRSENLKESKKSSCGRLRRSETNASSEIFDSDDELRYKIESFIARQRRNQIDY